MGDLRERIIAEIRGSVYESDDVSEIAHREAAERAADDIMALLKMERDSDTRPADGDAQQGSARE